jgi:hypothetical protein
MFTCIETGAWIYSYTISNYVADAMIDYQLFRGEDCDIDITYNDYLVPHLIGDATIIGYGTVTRQVAIVLTPDPEAITSSPIFTTNEDGSEVGLKWCMRLGLFTEDQGILVNWKDIEVDMRVSLSPGVRALEQTDRRLAKDCSNGFDVVFDPVNVEVFILPEPSATPTESPAPTEFGASAAPTASPTLAPTAPTASPTAGPTPSPTAEDAEQVTTTNSTSGFGGIVIAPTSSIPIFGGGASGSDKIASTFFLVEAFMCTSENLPLDPNDQDAVRLTGSIVRVCVQPNAGAISQGLYMRSVDSFYFSKNDTDFLQFAIEGGQSDFLGFTVEMNCERGSEICSFDTIMRADLFSTTGVVVGHGVATLQFGNANSRRFLSAGIGDRELIQGGKTRYTGFDLTIPVLSRYESQRVQASSGLNDVWPIILLGLALYIIWVGTTLAVIRHKRKWVDFHLTESDGVVVNHSGVKDGHEVTLEPFINSNDASQVDPEVGGKVADQGLDDVVHGGPKIADRSLNAKQHTVVESRLAASPEVGGKVAHQGINVAPPRGPKAIRQVAHRSLDAKKHTVVKSKLAASPEVGVKFADQGLDVAPRGPKSMRQVADRSLDAKQHTIV